MRSIAGAYRFSHGRLHLTGRNTENWQLRARGLRYAVRLWEKPRKKQILNPYTNRNGFIGKVGMES